MLRKLLQQVDRPEFAEYMSGNKKLPGSIMAAHCYCGYQFGHFSGQLGDGAAIYLGEVMTCVACVACALYGNFPKMINYQRFGGRLFHLHNSGPEPPGRRSKAMLKGTSMFLIDTNRLSIHQAQGGRFS